MLVCPENSTHTEKHKEFKRRLTGNLMQRLGSRRTASSATESPDRQSSRGGAEYQPSAPALFR
jgi:hypothetical protein